MIEPIDMLQPRCHNKKNVFAIPLRKKLDQLPFAAKGAGGDTEFLFKDTPEIEFIVITAKAGNLCEGTVGFGQEHTRLKEPKRGKIFSGGKPCFGFEFAREMHRAEMDMTRGIGDTDIL